MKRKKLLSWALMFCMVTLVCVPALAEGAKEEIIYATLDGAGTPTGVYVVNILPGGEQTDFGAYSEVRNMTTEDALNFDGARVTVTTQAERLYYEGALDAQTPLPWLVEVRYALDGETIQAEDVAGKTGHLTLTIQIAQNPTCGGNFYDVLALQTTVLLDTNLCRNIECGDAISANVGADKQLVYTALPGKGDIIEISADVTAFEMEPISINAMAFTLPLDTSTISSASQLNQLNVVSLNTRASSALAGKVQSAAGAVKADIDKLRESGDAAEAALAAANETLGEWLSGQTLTRNNYSVLLSAIRTAENAGKVDSAQKMLEAILAVQDALTELSEGNLATLVSGADQLSESAATLQEKAATLKQDVTDGITAYIDEMIPSDYALISFADARNGQVDSVLFVFQTPSVTLPEVETEEIVAHESDTFLDRLMNLFK